jgi:hypothetical protein
LSLGGCVEARKSGSHEALTHIKKEELKRVSCAGMEEAGESRLHYSPQKKKLIVQKSLLSNIGTLSIYRVEADGECIETGRESLRKLWKSFAQKHVFGSDDVIRSRASFAEWLDDDRARIELFVELYDGRKFEESFILKI